MKIICCRCAGLDVHEKSEALSSRRFVDHESILRSLATSVGDFESDSLAYANEAGTVTASSVPESSSLVRTSLPPANLVRSRMPRIP
jgi:hypothetical protein